MNLKIIGKFAIKQVFLFIQATVEFALGREELREEFLAYLIRTIEQDKLEKKASAANLVGS